MTKLKLSVINFINLELGDQNVINGGGRKGSIKSKVSLIIQDPVDHSEPVSIKNSKRLKIDVE